MIYIIAALILYTTAILLGTAASRNADTNLVSLITNSFSVLIPLAIVLPHISKKALSSHKFGVTVAILGGIVVGLFVMALNKSFSENKVGIVTPIVFGGAILLSSVLSIFIFKEKVTLLEGTGLSLVLIGLSIVIYARAVIN
jgi:multidrug transporter EmrE-like cation transporter